MSDHKVHDPFAAGKGRLRPGSRAALPEESGHTAHDGMGMSEIERRNAQRADLASDAAGFASRQAPPMIRRRRRRIVSDEPQTTFTVRCPVSVYNRLVGYVESSASQSYWDALERLMNAANLDENGIPKKEGRGHGG
ncbi:hypothetical protein AA14337_0780 [Acetobacter malorum DSM 14337]|uniref:Uncharacterized protein n=1 Tax=Acetobacter malorum DSM 14337 TaxID=1307910 RepID=A0ABQ0PQ25_9PROT|nr:hypothetical protein [Acetobacter malorum]KXV08711.1 hypothetical protein AD930_03630 [Acetobacter malorum]GBQ77307.1 hypothetical protein AA14337_0780 [Acetobacter malorum DSM 14337]